MKAKQSHHFEVRFGFKLVINLYFSSSNLFLFNFLNYYILNCLHLPYQVFFLSWSDYSVERRWRATHRREFMRRINKSENSPAHPGPRHWFQHRDRGRTKLIAFAGTHSGFIWTGKGLNQQTGHSPHWGIWVIPQICKIWELGCQFWFFFNFIFFYLFASPYCVLTWYYMSKFYKRELKLK